MFSAPNLTAGHRDLKGPTSRPSRGFFTAHNTYDHRVWKTGLPVRSAVLKPHAGELVVGWVTTSESSLLYVFIFVCFCYHIESIPLKLIGPPSLYCGTYDHRVWKIGLPVRSAVLKPHAGELVVGWVTTSESSLLYVFVPLFIIVVVYLLSRLTIITCSSHVKIVLYSLLIEMLPCLIRQVLLSLIGKGSLFALFACRDPATIRTPLDLSLHLSLLPIFAFLVLMHSFDKDLARNIFRGSSSRVTI
ncbi:hypothetical protein VN97_g6717 [Penicillium thymicola]|uniref:Uncharacterized protein n=1 Tax=Penicillium thymicola TaxID=293382 RepID=A0AAI9THM9_PENTH|nr:hypothetical protein VN97_g6717 [Penicillium thymicola]